MAFKLKIRNKVRVPVKGSIAGEDGKPEKFEFTLICNRLNQSAIDSVLSDKDQSVRDFLRGVTEGWEDVLDEDGIAIAFGEKSFAEVLEQVGMPTICFGAYLKEVAAAAKN